MILLLGPLLLALGVPQDERDSLAFRVIDENSQSGFQTGMEKFISSEKDWVAIWQERQGNVKTKVPHPRIDFDRHVVVVAAMGMKKTTGYSIEITRVVKTKDDIRIFLRKTVPAEDTFPAVRVTSPFVIARMEKPDRPVVFIDEAKK